MRLILPKPKKFWSPAIITQGGGKFIASLIPTFINQFSTTNASGSAVFTVDVTLALPTIPSGALLVSSAHVDANTLTGITFDPAGQNIAMTLETGATAKPILCDCVLPSGAASGSYVFRIAASGGSGFQFRLLGVNAWYLVGQTVNSPENIKAVQGGAVTSFAVTAGRAMVASAYWGGSQTTTWSVSTVVPSSTHASSTPVVAAAEWTTNLTTTASWTVASAAGNPAEGTVAATYK